MMMEVKKYLDRSIKLYLDEDEETTLGFDCPRCKQDRVIAKSLVNLQEPDERGERQDYDDLSLVCSNCDWFESLDYDVYRLRKH
jgi:hypothetical protein